MLGHHPIHAGVWAVAIGRIDVINPYHDARPPALLSLCKRSHTDARRTILLVIPHTFRHRMLSFQQGLAESQFHKVKGGKTDIIESGMERINTPCHFFLEITHTTIKGCGRFHLGSRDVHQSGCTDKLLCFRDLKVEQK